MIDKIRLQPLVSLESDYVFGYESLYKKGDLSEFPSAVAILKSVFSECKFADDFQLFINMTENDAADPDFSEIFIKTMNEVNAQGKNIVLEVSENTNPDFIDLTKQNLIQLRNHGIQIALDDFGTKYSTLTFMSEFPIDIVKIDQRFVQMAPSSKKARSLMKFVVQVSHDLGCKVVAEGIESNATLKCAIDVGADIGQGFLFSTVRKKASPFLNLCEFIHGIVRTPTKVCYCTQ